ncbi:MAG: sigma-54-dependent Fis family transcriptional regulator [Desulfobacterales bacterium]|nr:sigma-54-dependent Fis family transcriptional regulator [Desulfobacterales bacterium]
MAKILIIDDDKGICATLSRIVTRLGHDPATANTLKSGAATAAADQVDVVFLDVNMPDGSGLELLPEITKIPSKPEVIIITGKGSADGAELAIKNGAWDYIQKPSSVKEMTLPLVRALQYREEKSSDKHMSVLRTDGIIGSSPQFIQCLDRLAQAAGSGGNVIITGETGTGKELFSRAIHENSVRRDSPYVIVDCTAIPESLVESTLFGHVKGAFTGAATAAEGLIKQADGGTLLLDEVGELPLSVQKRFLRVLQEKRFRPVGGKREIDSDFRLLAATNRDLGEMTRQGKFRSDLLYRLQTFRLELPPLRKRREDIKALAMYHMTRLCEHYNSGTKGFSPEFLEAISIYEWPGNVRELVNTLERTLAVAGLEHILYPKHLPEYIRIKLAREGEFQSTPEPGQSVTATGEVSRLPSFKAFREKAMVEIEAQYLEHLLQQAGGNTKEALRISGLGKSRFYELLKKHKMTL